MDGTGRFDVGKNRARLTRLAASTSLPPPSRNFELRQAVPMASQTEFRNQRSRWIDPRG
jgi:hypothetical protein